jgi:hypothetical protein
MLFQAQYCPPMVIGDDGVMLALLDGLKLDQYIYIFIVTMKNCNSTMLLS